MNSPWLTRRPTSRKTVTKAATKNNRNQIKSQNASYSLNRQQQMPQELQNLQMPLLSPPNTLKLHEILWGESRKPQAKSDALRAFKSM